MKKFAQHFVLFVTLPISLLVIFPTSVDAATSKTRAEIIEISSKQTRSKKYTVTIRFRITGLAKNERVLRTIVTSGRTSCTARGNTKRCELRSVTKGTSLRLVAKSITNRTKGRNSARVQYIVGSGKWKKNPAQNEVQQNPSVDNGVVSSNACTINGTSGNDILEGTSGNDIICGWGGSDTISGGDGDDVIYSWGPPGVSARSVSARHVTIVQKQSTDSVGDSLDAGAGNDTIYAGAGDDTLTGGSGADTVAGGNGNDEIYAGTGDDALSGEAGDDFILGEEGTDSINGGEGFNRCDRDSDEPVVPSCLYDTQAPRLLSLSLSTNSINTESNAENITIEARITDDLVGPAGGNYSSSPSQLRFVHSSGQSFTAMFNSEKRISGDERDGIYQEVLTIPRGVAQGMWIADSFFLADQVGNIRYLSTTQMTQAGFDMSFEQVGRGDSEAPELISMTLSTRTIDTSSTAQTIDVTVRITDNLIGIESLSNTSGLSQVRFRHSSGQIVDAVFTADDRVSGTPTDGIYTASLSVRYGAAQGTWTAEYFYVYDQVGNSRAYSTSEMDQLSFPTSFEQQGQGDIDAPQLLSMTLSRRSIDTASSSEVIEVTVRITDDFAGPAGGNYSSSPSQVRFIHSSGQTVDAIFNAETRIAGNAQDGTYKSTLTLPIGAAQGTWVAQGFLLADQVGNMVIIPGSQLTASGFETDFVNGNP